MVRLSVRESIRQAIHIGTGFLAFSLRWVSPLQLSWLALAGLLFNAILLPRLGGLGLWRREESGKGMAAGIVLYPLTVLLLLLIFGRRPEVAAAGWGLLAFGDGMASVIGSAWGQSKLPWNPAKSWAGLIAFWLAGAAAVGVLVQWVAPGIYSPGFVWAVSFGVGLFTALLESMPTDLDDNLAVPLVGSLVLVCSLSTEGGWLQLLEAAWLERLGVALAVNIALAGIAHRLRALDRGGWFASSLVGGAILAFLGWRGYMLLLLFFLMGTAATRVGYRRKELQGIAQEDEGQRTAWNVLANGAVAAGCALFAVVSPFHALFALAFAGALAAANADTLESEIGQLRGGPTVLITTLERVPVGTDGGISLVGTMAGALGSLVVAVCGGFLGLYPAGLVGAVALAGWVATLLESFVGASLERRGYLGNDAVNLFNTLAGGLLAVGMVGWLG